MDVCVWETYLLEHIEPSATDNYSCSSLSVVLGELTA